MEGDLGLPVKVIGYNLYHIYTLYPIVVISRIVSCSTVHASRHSHTIGGSSLGSWSVKSRAPSSSWMQVEIEGITQMSSVHIKRCRYLAESGCAGMCINLCKSPTQVTEARPQRAAFPRRKEGVCTRAYGTYDDLLRSVVAFAVLVL